MKLSRIGIDLAKNVFQLHGVDRHGKTVWKRRLSRNKWLKALLEQAEPGCVIGMEACGGAHHWARELQSRGYTVKLIPPQFVKPYVKSNKNDANDAEAICEAMSRPNMRFVAVKSVAQQDIQAVNLHVQMTHFQRVFAFKTNPVLNCKSLVFSACLLASYGSKFSATTGSKLDANQHGAIFNANPGAVLGANKQVRC